MQFEWNGVQLQILPPSEELPDAAKRYPWDAHGNDQVDEHFLPLCGYRNEPEAGGLHEVTGQVQLIAFAEAAFCGAHGMRNLIRPSILLPVHTFPDGDHPC